MKNKIQIADYNITEDDFEHTLKHKPKDQEELEEFARLCRKGMEAQIDWDIIFDCAKDEMTRE